MTETNTPVVALLSRPGTWTQRCDAIRADGSHANPWDPDAVAWCFIGAIYKCYYSQTLKFKEVIPVIGRVVERIGPDIESWNDHPDRTIDDVLALARELGI